MTLQHLLIKIRGIVGLGDSTEDPSSSGEEGKKIRKTEKEILEAAKVRYSFFLSGVSDFK